MGVIRSTVVPSIRAREYANYLAGRAQHERGLDAPAGETASRGAYYASGDGVAEARWHGGAQALESLGLRPGIATADQIHAALMGRHFGSGAQVRKPGNRKLPDGSTTKVVNSHDLTPSVPKSVSVLWANSGPAQRALIEQMVARSAHASMQYLFKNVPTVQRRDDMSDRMWEVAQDVMYCTTMHTTARAAKGEMPDPHLHIHCLVVGVINSDGDVRTPNNRQLCGWRGDRISEVGAFFRADLARQLRERGIELTYHDEDRRYFEIAGVPESLCREMSKRSGEVEAKAKEFEKLHKRKPNAAEKADFAASTRQAKDGETIAELEPYWRARSREHGFDEQAVAGIWQRRELVRGNMAELRRQVEARIATKSMVTQAQARMIALELGAAEHGVVDVDRVLNRLLKDKRLLMLENGNLTACTTRVAEQRVLDVMGGREMDPLPHLAVHAAIDATQDRLGKPLSGEQIDAIKTATGGSAVSVVVGVAGSGKGTVIEAVATSHRLCALDVVVCAVQGARALEAGAQGRCDAERALTIDKLTYRLETGRLRLDAGSVVIVDEAGMVDTRRFGDLLDAARERDLRVVMVGDPKQLQPIEAGGMFPVIMEHCPTSTLAEVHRAKHEWLREAGLDFRNGQANRALNTLRDHGAAHLAEDFDGAIQAGVERYEQLGRDHIGSRLIVVEGTNRHVDDVNSLVQLRRIARGELGPESVKAPDRDYHLHVGDQVMFRQCAYRPTGQEPVANGTCGKVIGIEGNKLEVRIKEPSTGFRTVSVDTDAMKGSAVRLAYAAHVYPAQGLTVDHAICISHPDYLTRASAYVGESRARESYTLYTGRTEISLGRNLTDDQCWGEYARYADRTHHSEASIQHAVVDRPLEPRKRFRSKTIEENPRVELERLEQLHRHKPRRPEWDDPREFYRALRAYVATGPNLAELQALGSRPTGEGFIPEFKQKAWDRAASNILNYRMDHGITDRTSALGPAIDGPRTDARRAFDKTLHQLDKDLRHLGGHKPAAPIVTNLQPKTLQRARDMYEGGLGLGR